MFPKNWKFPSMVGTFPPYAWPSQKPGKIVNDTVWQNLCVLQNILYSEKFECVSLALSRDKGIQIVAHVVPKCEAKGTFQ